MDRLNLWDQCPPTTKEFEQLIKTTLSKDTAMVSHSIQHRAYVRLVLLRL